MGELSREELARKAYRRWRYAYWWLALRIMIYIAVSFTGSALGVWLARH